MSESASALPGGSTALAAPTGGSLSGLMDWLRDRSLTLVFLGCFLVFLAGQVVTGWVEYNQEQREHHEREVGLSGYFATGHLWEAIFENWESEFLQMAMFVGLTTRLYQKGSPESKRPGVVELVDADPRRFQHLPEVPWPVRRGGWVLKVYEHSLLLAMAGLFLLSWAGHGLGGWAALRADQISHGEVPDGLGHYLASARFWFESMQNWQSEFLAMAAMVWLSVYLRQRGSPESKPVHAAHSETGR